MKPTMNAACVSKCVKGGKTRSACMAQCYGDTPEKGRGKPTKKKGRRY